MVRRIGRDPSSRYTPPALRTLVRSDQSRGCVLLDGVRRPVRCLAREPPSAVAMVVTLALGIGMTTAIFPGLDAVIIRPLPCAAPHPLVVAAQQYRTARSWSTLSPAN